MILSEDPDELHVFLGQVSGTLDMLEKRFESPECKLSLQDWIGSKLNPFLHGKN